MGLDKSILHAEHIARHMSSADRAREGVMTAAEARDKASVKDERELQRLVANYLVQRGLWHDQDGMHKRRTGTLGTPDFIFPFKGKFVAWECKPPWSTRLRPEQETARQGIVEQGGQWRLITTLDEARQHLSEL